MTDDLEYETCGECGRHIATNPDNDLCRSCENTIWMMRTFRAMAGSMITVCVLAVASCSHAIYFGGQP